MECILQLNLTLRAKGVVLPTETTMHRHNGEDNVNVLDEIVKPCTEELGISDRLH